MKLKLLNLAVLLLCLSGCLELGSDSQDTKSKTDCRLSKSTTTVTNNHNSRYSYVLNYTYTADGQLASITAPDTIAMNIRFTYDSENRLRSERMNNYTWTSEYNSKGQLVKQVRTFEFAEERFETYYLSHNYSSSGELTESKYYAVEDGGDVLIYTYRYLYSNDNISGIEKISAQDTRHYIATFVTDNQKAPLPALPMHMLYMFRDETLPIMGILNGNITSYSVTRGEGDAGFRSFTASITYNNTGYPTAVARTYADGSSESSTYTYSCE